MLLGRQAPSLNLSMTKCIVEILIANHNLYNYLFDVSLQDIRTKTESWGMAHLSNLEKVLLYMEKVFQADKAFCQTVRVKYSEFLWNFDPRNLPSFYMDTPKVEQDLRNFVSYDLRTNYGIYPITDSQWTYIYGLLRKHVRERSSGYKYDEGSQAMVGFIHHSVTYFTMKYPEEMLETLSSFGLNQEEDDNDYSAIMYQTDTLDSAEDLQNFDTLAMHIYGSTDFLYRHNNLVYYDIFSRYKLKLLEEKKAEITAALAKASKGVIRTPKASIYDTNMTVARGRSDETMKYARAKLAAVDTIISPFDALVSGTKGIQQVPEIIQTVMDLNQGLADSGSGGDGKLIFHTRDYPLKTPLSNTEMQERLFFAFSALKTIVDHAKKTGINIFSIKSDIFKNPRLPKRFPTLKEYLKWGSVVMEVMKKETETEKPAGLLSNDQMYEKLVSSSILAVNKIPLHNLKDVVESCSVSARTSKKKVESIINAEIMERHRNLALAFSAPPTEKSTLRDIYASQIGVSESLKKMFLTKGIVKSDNDVWSVEIDPNLDKLMEQVFAKTPHNYELYQLLLKYFSIPSTKDKSLHYFRVLDVIRVYIDFVKYLVDKLYITYEGVPVFVSSKFQLFGIMVKDIQLYTTVEPKTFEHVRPIMDKFDLKYYAGLEGITPEIEQQIVLVSKICRAIFKPLFDYLRELYNTVYLPFSKGIELDVIPQAQLKRKLQEAGTILYQMPESSALKNESFRNFLKVSAIDKTTGFVLKEGLYLVDYYYRNPRYLHERGYWATVINGNVSSMDPVEEDYELWLEH